MDKQLLAALGVEPAAAEAILAVAASELPPMLRGVAEYSPPGEGPRAFTRDMLAGMSAEEINRHWEAVKASLSH